MTMDLAALVSKIESNPPDYIIVDGEAYRWNGDTYEEASPRVPSNEGYDPSYDAPCLGCGEIVVDALEYGDGSGGLHHAKDCERAAIFSEMIHVMADGDKSVHTLYIYNQPIKE